MSVLQSGCTTWTLTKCIKKRLDENYTRRLRTILNKSWKEHSTKQQLYCYLHLMSKTIQEARGRRLEKQGRTHKWRSSMDPYTATYLPSQKTIPVIWTRHVGDDCRSKDELISDVLLSTPTHGSASVGWPENLLHQLCKDTGCKLKNLLGVMDDMDGWSERVGNMCYQCNIQMSRHEDAVKLAKMIWVVVSELQVKASRMYTSIKYLK